MTDAALLAKCAFREESQRFAALGRPDDLACIARATGMPIALDEFGTGPTQQEMCNGDVPQFAFDHKTEARRQVSFKQYAIDVTGVISDDDAIVGGQVVHADNLDLDAGQNEHAPRYESGQSLATRGSRDEYGDQQGEDDRYRERQPGQYAP